MNESNTSNYHWHPNLHLNFFSTAFPWRFELGRASDQDSGSVKQRGFRFYFGLLGFGVHFSRDGEYMISGIQTPLFHIGATKIETIAV